LNASAGLPPIEEGNAAIVFAGGKVNQFSLAKFPIYRIERVPPGADVFETIKPRVDTELGFRRLPGSAR
jgi:hypothetical protein